MSGRSHVRNWGEITLASARNALAAAAVAATKTASAASARRAATQTQTITAAAAAVVAAARTAGSVPERSSDPGSPAMIVAS